MFPARFTILNDKNSFFKKSRKKTEKQTNSKQKYRTQKIETFCAPYIFQLTSGSIEKKVMPFLRLGGIKGREKNSICTKKLTPAFVGLWCTKKHDWLGFTWPKTHLISQGGGNKPGSSASSLLHGKTRTRKNWSCILGSLKTKGKSFLCINLEKHLT